MTRNQKWDVRRFSPYKDNAGRYKIKMNGRHYVGYVRFGDDADEGEILRAIERLSRVRLPHDVHFDWLSSSAFNLEGSDGKPLYQIVKGIQ